MSLFGSDWSRETGLRSPFTPVTSLATQNALRIRRNGSEKVTHMALNVAHEALEISVGRLARKTDRTKSMGKIPSLMVLPFRVLDQTILPFEPFCTFNTI